MTAPHRSPLSERIEAILTLDRDAPAIEFRGRWSTWGQLADLAAAVGDHVEPGQRVGVLLRNRPAHAGLLVALLQAGATVVTVNPGRGEDRVREDLAALALPVLAGDPEDLGRFASASPGARQMEVGELRRPLVVRGATVAGSTPGPADPVAVEMLTSGTTGPPKRIPLTYRTFERVLAGAKYYEKDQAAAARLRAGVAVVNAPLVHLGGLFRILQCVTDGRSICLLERFSVSEWVDAVRRHRPKTASLVPTALRMVLDADLDPADLASIRSVVSGTAPLSPDDADAFQEKYGIPVLVSYAATEFGGGVAGWNLGDHQRYWTHKRGSVGRAHPGCELRVVDPDGDTPLPPGAEGLLEVRAAQIGDGRAWTRTTDLARIDDDGFVWILGRADQAIIRGGFKIRPDDVRVAIERDRRVAAAAVVGRADHRLGEVPVAAVELRPLASATPDDLRATLAGRLAPYEVPAEIRIVDELPRTPSAKVDLAAVRSLFEGRGTKG